MGSTGQKISLSASIQPLRQGTYLFVSSANDLSQSSNFATQINYNIQIIVSDKITTSASTRRILSEQFYAVY